MELPVGEISVNGPVLWFGLAVTLVTGVVFGLAPVVPTMRSNIVGSLKEGGHGEPWAPRTVDSDRCWWDARWRSHWCDGGRRAAAPQLLEPAARRIRGFDPKRVIVANLWMPRPNGAEAQFKYGKPETRNTFMREVLRRARLLPGVEVAAIGTGNATPLSGFNKATYVPEGSNPAAGDLPVAQATTVTPDFFRALGIRLVAGRVFTDSDEGQKDPVVLVDETLARRAWPGQNAVGKRLGVGRGPVWMTVVGVVGAIKSGSLEEDNLPHLYGSAFQRSNLGISVFLRTSGYAAGLAESLRREVQAVDPELPVFGVRTMEQVVARSLAQRRFQLQAIGAFAAVALLVAALGIYGVTAFWVNQRTQEIGIRLALGAGGGDVVRMVLRKGLTLAGWGIAAGIAGALPLGSLLRTLALRNDGARSGNVRAVAALLFGTAALACYLPARRATRVDPTTRPSAASSSTASPGSAPSRRRERSSRSRAAAGSARRSRPRARRAERPHAAAPARPPRAPAPAPARRPSGSRSRRRRTARTGPRSTRRPAPAPRRRDPGRRGGGHAVCVQEHPHRPQRPRAAVREVQAGGTASRDIRRLFLWAKGT